MLLQALGLWVRPHVFWPLLVAAVGMALLWRQADESERQEWLSTSDGWRSWVRVIAGILLLLAALGIGLFQAGASGGRLSVTDVLIAVLLAMLGVGLVLGPWVLRLNHDLRRERTERIRTQERADVAAHLHDSVLQTLALIQRQAGDPETVATWPGRRSASCAPGCSTSRRARRRPSRRRSSTRSPRSRTRITCRSSWSSWATAR